MKALRPLFLIVSLILMVGLACSVGSPSEPTAEPTTAAEPTDAAEEPTAVVEDEPTDPVDEPTPTDEPADPADSAQEFYTETFDGSLDNYTYFNTGKGDEDKMSIKTDDGFLNFDLKDNNLWMYVTYNPFTYKDVSIEIVADNRGKNNNNVTLLCRYDPEEGWYEFNIANNGLYWIFAYDATGAINKGYNQMANGASKFVKQGREVNTYKVDCVGDKLTLTVNGVEAKTFKDTKYKLRDGKVGFGVSSFEVTPIQVNVDSFSISQP